MALVLRSLGVWLVKTFGISIYRDLRAGKLPSVRRARRAVVIAMTVAGTAVLGFALLTVVILVLLIRAIV